MNHACYNCGSEELSPLYSAPAFDAATSETSYYPGLARCRLCAVVNTTGITEADIADSYHRQYYGSGSSKFIPLIEAMLGAVNTARAKKILRAWQGKNALTGPPSVLDIGCGRGQLLQAFKDRGATVLGLERTEFPGGDRPRDFVQVGAISEPQYAGRMFDIVILWHVLEHLEATEAVLDSICEHHNAGGLLLIAVPNFASTQQRLFSRHWFHLDLPRHLVHLESDWLQRRLTERGYTIESVSYLDPVQNIYGFVQSALNKLVPSRLNQYYQLLKHGQGWAIARLVPLALWSLLSLLLLPFALLDCLLGSLFARGATVKVAARRGPRNDQQ